MNSRAKTIRARPAATSAADQERTGFAISSADGTPIYYSRGEPARGSGKADVVLTDGIGCDGYVWKYLRRSLGRDYRTLHWNYRGHGRTPPPRDESRVSIADLADDLADVLDDAGVERAILFGHSMGVQVTLETYRRHRERVSAMVLMCGAPGSPLGTFKGSSAGARVLPVLRSLVKRAPRAWGSVWRAAFPTNLSMYLATRLEVNGRYLEREDFMPYLEGIARVDVELFLAMLAEAQRHDARSLLPAIDVPVLIVAGDRDGFTPASLSHAMHEAIPDAELLVIARGSHTAPLERPHLVDETVADFLTRRVS